MPPSHPLGFPLPRASAAGERGQPGAQTRGRAGSAGLRREAELSLPAREAVTFPSKQKQNPTNSRKFQNRDGKTPEHRLGAEKPFSDQRWKLFAFDSQMLWSKNSLYFFLPPPQEENFNSPHAACCTRGLSAVPAQKAGRRSALAAPQPLHPAFLALPGAAFCPRLLCAQLA